MDSILSFLVPIILVVLVLLLGKLISDAVL